MRLVIFLVVLLVSSLSFGQQGGVFNYVKLLPTSLPTSCSLGDLRFDSSAHLVNYCSPSGTWNAFSISSTSPLTTLGDLLYQNSTPAPARLPGNTSSTKKFLNQTGTGTISAAPAWGVLGTGDIPSLDFSKVTTGTVPLTQGGSGQVTANASFNALAPSQTSNSGKYLKTDGTNTSWATVAAGGGTGINFAGLSTAWVSTSPDDVTADASVGNWLAFKNTASSTPGSLTGGSPTTTCLQTTTAGHILNGAGSFEWVIDAANRQGEGCSVLVNVPPGYSTAGAINATYQMVFNVKSGTFVAGDILVAAYDVTDSAPISVSNASIQSSGLLKANLVIPTTASQVRVGLYRAVTTAAAVTIDFDDVILGPATNLGTSTLSTDWKNDLTFTPASGAFGTITNTDYRYKRVGDLMTVRGNFQCGTTTTGNALIALPTGYHIDSSKITSGTNKQQVGYENRLATGGTVSIPTSGNSHVLFYDGSDTSSVYYARAVASAQFTKVLGNGDHASGDVSSFEFSVPIKEWATTGTTVTPNQIANTWSGSLAGTGGGWSTSSASYADFSVATTSTTLTEVTNSNFGTVVAEATKLPAITWTPSLFPALYFMCAGGTMVTGSTNNAYVQLVDGSNATINAGQSNGGVAGNYSFTLCGYKNITSSSSVTIKVRGATSSSTNGIRQDSLAPLNWSITLVTAQTPSPYFISSLGTDSSTKVMQMIAMKAVTNSGSSSVVSQTGNSFSFTSSPSAGKTIWGISAGTFSGTPYCTCTMDNINFSGTGYGCDVQNTSSTSIQIEDFQTGSAPGASASNLFVTVHCLGPH